MNHDQIRHLNKRKRLNILTGFVPVGLLLIRSVCFPYKFPSFPLRTLREAKGICREGKDSAASITSDGAKILITKLCKKLQKVGFFDLQRDLFSQKKRIKCSLNTLANVTSD